MRSGRAKIVGRGNPLAHLRARAPGPDPGFRAGLRERLVTAAARGEDGRNRARDDGGGTAAD
ncbi:hypothetical protein [Actinomadura algeriensis]|uniref:Uncharacterized protein n=1 Tax=Actinomadura algeriensis TaxID=1679523 RepID=A0ABR9JMC9_9ACTN|nr:hypothetical protein [Actinomadura algeriensis]MBE1531700.1 hypothetical protein [Actinomadura algeriensis]